jgi:hypothetical protein
MHRATRLVLAGLSIALAAVACDRATAPDSAPAPARPHALLGMRLLGCPSATSDSASAVVGPEGGALSLGGFRVDFPAGAVDSARTFVLAVPASDVLEIEVHAEGRDHYAFATPVTVTLDASRCGILPPGLQVWHIDGRSRALLEPMGGVVDLLSRTVRFRTSHFSGYSIAW